MLGAGGDDLAGEVAPVRAVGPVGQLEPHPAEAATGVPFDGDGDRRLVAGPARLTVAAAAQEALVEFDDAAEQLSFRAHHGPAQLVQPRPGGLIGTEPQGVLQTPRRHPVLLRGDEPDRREPGRQRRVGAMKDRAGRGRGLQATVGAHPQPACRSASSHRRRSVDTRTRAASANRQVLPTRPLVGEPGPELLIGPRIVTPADRTPIARHDTTLLHSSRYAGHMFDCKRISQPGKEDRVHASGLGIAFKINDDHRARQDRSRRLSRAAKAGRFSGSGNRRQIAPIRQQIRNLPTVSCAPLP